MSYGEFVVLLSESLKWGSNFLETRMLITNRNVKINVHVIEEV